MDYRNYRGEPLIKIPRGIRRRLHLLRYVGLALSIVGVAIPFLTLVKLITGTYFTNLLTWILATSGPVLFLIGLAFDNIFDRAG